MQSVSRRPQGYVCVSVLQRLIAYNVKLHSQGNCPSKLTLKRKHSTVIIPYLIGYSETISNVLSKRFPYASHTSNLE